MKYGETAFDIFYLLFAIICGCAILRKARSKTETLMGAATLVLGCGDAFHLVPRILNYFTDVDVTAALGVGKLVTSVTMTIFYLMMFYIWRGLYQEKGNAVIIWLLTLLRIILCLFPQNGWLENSENLSWGIIRNIPFVILGMIICAAYFRKRSVVIRFKNVWLYVLLSFAFYIPVVTGAGAVPMLGMLMLPKTVCYILLILTFALYVIKADESRAGNS